MERGELEILSSIFVLQRQRYNDSVDLNNNLVTNVVEEDPAIANINSLRPICGSPSDQVFCLACETVHSHHEVCPAQN